MDRGETNISNWKTISSSFRPLTHLSTSCGSVTKGISPTAMVSNLSRTSLLISCRNSCRRGPFAKYIDPFWYSSFGLVTDALGRSGVLLMRFMTSMRKPAMPFSSQKLMMLYTSFRRTGDSQLRSGCEGVKRWR